MGERWTSPAIGSKGTGTNPWSSRAARRNAVGQGPAMAEASCLAPDRPPPSGRFRVKGAAGAAAVNSGYRAAEAVLLARAWLAPAPTEGATSPSCPPAGIAVVPLRPVS